MFLEDFFKRKKLKEWGKTLHPIGASRVDARKF